MLVILIFFLFFLLYILRLSLLISSRNEDRPGTPTVDEPGMGVNVASPTNVYTGPIPPYTAAPPVGSIPPIMGLPQPPVLQVCLNSYSSPFLL